MVEIYWLQRLGNIGFCFNIGFWLCIVIAIVIAVWCFMDDFETFRDKHLIRWVKKFAMVFAFLPLAQSLYQRSMTLW